EVLLSFDDGPDPRWTPQVLAILRAENVKAVFCVVGAPMARHPELVKQEHDEGHVRCDHTVHHDMHMSTKPDAYTAGEIDAPFDTIKSITGEPPRFYRGPGGDLSPFIIGEAHRLGLRVLGWSVDTVDYRRPGAAAIQNRAVDKVRGGGVILMHDGGGDRSETVAQLTGLIDRLRAAGYSFVVP
ncbi:MAG: peptidoglycan-N-acetylglucosamine deacetylase, partial [Actinomycetota bacterium]